MNKISEKICTLAESVLSKNKAQNVVKIDMKKK